MLVCEGCANNEARFVRIKFIPTERDEKGNVLNSKKTEVCDKCDNVRPSYARDAAGGKVDVPTGTNMYSYAIDGRITGSRQYSEILKKHDLSIKNNI